MAIRHTIDARGQQAVGRGSRSCRRCGGPLAVAPGVSAGVRCAICGATPSSPSPASAVASPPVNAPPNGARLVPIAIEQQSTRPHRAHAAPFRAAGTVMVGLIAGWASELHDVPPGTWVTVAAAAVGLGVAVVAALTVR